MTVPTGYKQGLILRATIRRYNNDGTVQVRIDEGGASQFSQEYKADLPLSWSGPEGEFMGGFPPVGAPVGILMGQGGAWYIVSYLKSQATFSDSSVMATLRPGRAVLQVKDGTRIFADPKIGIQAGDANEFLHIDPKLNLISHNFENEMSFTQASRQIDGLIKRDLKENSNRNILGSTLDSHIYETGLSRVGMDPTITPTVSTLGAFIRNPALVENREIYYEFANNFDVGSDAEEITKLVDPQSPDFFDNGKKENRTDVLSLSQQFPNHIIETIKGTVVDVNGNILDINRNILPIGKIEELSLFKNTDKVLAQNAIKAALRKSIAFHWEINTKKAGEFDEQTGVEDTAAVPDIDDVSNYGRNRSKFFVDIDKEGQFKINVPASSERGNIPLLTRYENYSNIIAKKDGTTNPNSFIKNADKQDVYLDSFAGTPNIALKSSDPALDGYESPKDRITGEPMKFGTAFHDITKACAAWLTTVPVPRIYSDHPLYTKPYSWEYEKIVEPTLIVSGKDANAGGRSGTISTDGHVALNFGANTSDRQSLWIDCAGGVVSQIGRDKRGISYAASLDGDMIIQLGGPGLDSKFDKRFEDENDNPRIGALDIRIMDGDRPATTFRIDKYGISVVTEGKFSVQASQGIDLITHAGLNLNGERVGFFTDSKIPRIVERGGSKKI